MNHRIWNHELSISKKELNRIHKPYEKAALYQTADPEISLSQARKSAEAMCKNIYVREGLEEDGKPVSKLMLNDLISTLTRSGVLPKHIIISLNTIQSFGNFGAHDQGDDNDYITEEYIKPCLHSLNTVYSITEDGVQINYDLNGYRLPSEAEWEYACRAGSSTYYYWGDSEKEASIYAWFDVNSDDITHTIGTKKKNAFGLFDMVGKVWEWTNDYYSQDYYHNSEEENPRGPEFGDTRVLKGGCWFNGQNRLRSSCRLKRLPNLLDDVTGFRIASSYKL